MIRAFAYPLYPTQSQERLLISWLASCCDLYNAALEERKEAWRRQRVSITRYMQQKELTELRAADPEWRAVPALVARSALIRSEHAFAGFFRRVSRGDVPGFPRFKSKQRYKSFDLPGVTDVVRVRGASVQIPCMPPMKFKLYRPMLGTVRHVRITQVAAGWRIAFLCDLGSAPAKIPVRSAVGLDVGLENFVTLSTGEAVSNPRFLRSTAFALKQKEQSLSAKQRGSRSWFRAKLLIEKYYAALRNRRLDFSRKLVAHILSRFDLVVHEDLCIAQMVRGTMAKSIYDASWGVFLRSLALKAESAGKHVIAVDPSGTSQTCPACGTVAKKTLEEREHRCSSCGFSAHRDHAAAQVILGRGLRLGQLTEAVQTVEPASMMIS